MNTIRLAGVIRQSIVDGPGLRLTVFTQGCPHNCPGCHNPQTHDFAGGYDSSAERVLAEYDKNPLLKGITISGGEPVCQAAGLIPLAEGIKTRGGDVILYSGYTFEELLERSAEDEAVETLLGLTDILIDGRFELDKRDLNRRFRGSGNQRILDVGKSLAAGVAVEAALPD
jgi:anaerobic ribonucleoside-triphosphate reductase activating protein